MTDQIEMFWKCSTCGTINGGLSKKCGERIVKNGKVADGAIGGCGKAQDREEWFMPEDISKHANITNADNIRQAKAGADWFCGYCGSTQRRLDGECANCGGNRGFAKEDRNGKTEFTDTDDKWTGGKNTEDKQYIESHEEHHRREHDFHRVELEYDPDLDPDIPQRKIWPFIAAGLGLIALVALIVWLFTPRYVDATVVATNWTSKVSVERYQIIHDEGWDAPGDAFHIHNHGRRVHHHERVAVGSKQVPYQESYTCGQTCTTVSVPRVCTSNKNGTASCTGGGTRQSCSPKSCTRTAYRTETIYENQPRYRDWYSWDAWRWRHNRIVSRSGDDTEPLRPTVDKIALNKRCSNGEKERTSVKWVYITTFNNGDESFTFKPKSVNEFKSLPKGTERTLKVTALGVSVEK